MFGSRRRQQRQEAARVAAHLAAATSGLPPAPPTPAPAPQPLPDTAERLPSSTADSPEAMAMRLAGEVLPRIEQALIAIAAHAHRLDARLDALERRLDSGLDVLDKVATRSDLDDLRERTAQVGERLDEATAAVLGALATLQPSPAPASETIEPLFAPIPIPPQPR